MSKSQKPQAIGIEGEPAVDVARLFNGAYARVSSFVIEG
jgi:hypothetical protein